MEGRARAYQCQEEERPRGCAPRRCRHLFCVCGNPVLWLLVVDAGHRRLTAQAWGRDRQEPLDAGTLGHSPYLPGSDLRHW